MVRLPGRRSRPAAGGEAATGTEAGAILSALDKGLSIPRPVVVESVNRLRRAHPDEGPERIALRLQQRFLNTVTSSGAAVGAAAAVPGAGTGTAVAAVGGETVFFVGAAVLLTLQLAEVHGMPVEEVERRRALVLAIALGDTGTLLVRRATESFGAGWTGLLSADLPSATVRTLNNTLVRKFLMKVGTKQGFVTIGKLAPLGIGAVVGAGGNRALGHRLIHNARKAFGQAPQQWPTPLPPSRRSAG